jgi:hypothetical protein
MFYLTLCRDIEKGRHNDPGEEKVLPLTQESAADLNSMATLLGTLAKTFGGKHTDHVKNMSLYHCMTFFPLVAIC